MANLLHSIMQVPKSSSSGDPVATADTPPATGDIYDPNTLLWTPLFLLPITTGATHSHTLLDTPHPIPISTAAPLIHSFWTPLHLSTLPSYGRSITFDYLSSLSRVQAGVAAP